MSKIYLASSWRNKQQPALVVALRNAGHEVYDFRNPEGGIPNGFRWSDIDPRWLMWTAEQYRNALDHPLARQGFSSDFEAMKWADTGVLLLPCGRSAHLELGWMAGAGKRTIVVTQDDQEPELMALLADHIAIDWPELLNLLAQPYQPAGGDMDFQERTGVWMLRCFGPDITANIMERCYRFFEEAGELCQALGMTEEFGHELVRYTWSRSKGEAPQEVGGVMVTLAALCFAAGMDMIGSGETELARVNMPEIMERIRRKHAEKTLRTPLSALPGLVD